MNIKKLAGALAVSLGLGFSGAASSAITYYFPVTAFQDDDLDFVVDNNGNGILDAGDRLISVIEFKNTQGINAGQGPTDIVTPEITGIADLTITAVLPDGTLVFGASGASGVLSAFAAGTTAVFWQDTTPDLDVINANCGTRANCLSLAGLGGGDPGSSLFLSIGFFGDLDASWTSIPGAGGTTISIVQGGGSSTTFGAFHLAQQVGINNTGFILGEQACFPFCGIGGNNSIQVTGSGNILGGQGLNAAEWTARSDADAQIVPTVPEPGALALLGIALAGLGFVRSRGKSVA